MMDEIAFRQVYEQYWARLYDVCYYTIGSREAAEDIVMEIFVSLWRNRATLQVEKMEHYLVRAAKNQSLKHLVRQQRGSERLARMVDTLQNNGTDTPQRYLEAKELSARISEALKALPAKTREIFLLNREQGLTYEEIALRLDVSVKTVEYHMSKALRMLSRQVHIISLILFFY